MFASGEIPDVVQASSYTDAALANAGAEGGIYASGGFDSGVRASFMGDHSPGDMGSPALR